VTGQPKIISPRQLKKGCYVNIKVDQKKRAKKGGMEKEADTNKGGGVEDLASHMVQKKNQTNGVPEVGARTVAGKANYQTEQRKRTGYQKVKGAPK